ncbi:MAG: MarR family transcriptional regulator [Anaerolineae bacterium]|nr:MarR family transcriptional regulator [Anaerolineae bacterium]
MDETWDAQTLAKRMLEVMPKLSRLMALRMNTLTEKEATLMQMGALHMLINNNRMTTSDLAKKRQVSLQAASTFVQGLVDRGWVVRVDDPNDRRRSILEVTPEGRIREAELRDLMTSYMADALTSLSQEEIDAAKIFLAGLNRLTEQYDSFEEAATPSDT